MFVMIDILPHLAYHYSRVSQLSHFYVRNISRSFPFSPLLKIIPLYITSILRYLTLYIPVILLRKKYFSDVHD